MSKRATTCPGGRSSIRSSSCCSGSERWWWRAAGAVAAVGAAVVLLGLTGLLTARDYFVRFADPAVSAAPFDADVAAIARALTAERSAGRALVGPIEPDHPSLRYLVAGPAPT